MKGLEPVIYSLYTRETFKQQPAEFRMGAVISDGMWYSISKWRKVARVSEEEINDFVERNLLSGRLVQSPTGQRSYRFPLESIEAWYAENHIPMDVQLVDFFFPPRIWDSMTETEGFLAAPLREIGVFSFTVSSSLAEKITERLRGIARVREVEPGHYKAYCLEPYVAKAMVEDLLKEANPQEVEKVYCRGRCQRRELVDFTKEFASGLVLFYRSFGKTLVKRTMDTISIFLPEPEDQEAQVLMWVIDAIEKFDESQSVPFSGYLAAVLNRWPFSLPQKQLGKDLSDFQRKRAKSLAQLRASTGRHDFSNEELAQSMDMPKQKFDAFDAKNKIWAATKNATTITWEENSEEKSSRSLVEGYHATSVPTNLELAHKVSKSIIETALATERWDEAYELMLQVDANAVDAAKLKLVSEEFKRELGQCLGL